MAIESIGTTATQRSFLNDQAEKAVASQSQSIKELTAEQRQQEQIRNREREAVLDRREAARAALEGPLSSANASEIQQQQEQPRRNEVEGTVQPVATPTEQARVVEDVQARERADARAAEKAAREDQVYQDRLQREAAEQAAREAARAYAASAGQSGTSAQSVGDKPPELNVSA